MLIYFLYWMVMIVVNFYRIRVKMEVEDLGIYRRWEWIKFYEES